MPKYKESKYFFPISEKYPDYETGKGDYVLEHVDKKGKFWTAKPVFGEQEMDPKDIDLKEFPSLKKR